MAINEVTKKALISEVKINPKKIDIDILKNKAEKLRKNLKDYDIKYQALSLENM